MKTFAQKTMFAALAAASSLGFAAEVVPRESVSHDYSPPPQPDSGSHRKQRYGGDIAPVPRHTRKGKHKAKTAAASRRKNRA